MFTRAAIRAILLILFSLLAKEYIPMAALTLALLTAFYHTCGQQRRIEKLEDEYQGQRAINRAAVENHKAAYLALQHKSHATSDTSTVCTRAHYEHPSAETAREDHRLKERLHQLRLGRETTTCTRTHFAHSTVYLACANRVLKGRMHQLRVQVISLRADVERRNTVIRSLERSLETLRGTRAEENMDKDAAIEGLQRRMQVAAARHCDRCNEVLAAAHHNAEAFAMDASENSVRPRKSSGCVSTTQVTQMSTDLDQESGEEEL
jgi:hypothetical protein